MDNTYRVDEIDLREVFAVLRRRIWIIIAVPLIAAITSGVLSHFVLRPVYSASTTLWVIKQETTTLDYNTLLTNRNLVPTYAQVAKSRSVLDEVIRQLGLTGMTPDKLQEKLSVTPLKDTEIIQISVTDGAPALAARIADAVAAAFMDQLGSFIKLENVRVVDRAQIPTVPVKPRPVLNIAIATVLGGMVAVGLAFLLEYLDTTIKTSDDIERYLGLPVLAVIPLVDLEKGAETVKAHRHAKRRVKAERQVTVAK